MSINNSEIDLLNGQNSGEITKGQGVVKDSTAEQQE